MPCGPRSDRDTRETPQPRDRDTDVARRTRPPVEPDRLCARGVPRADLPASMGSISVRTSCREVRRRRPLRVLFLAQPTAYRPHARPGRGTHVPQAFRVGSTGARNPTLGGCGGSERASPHEFTARSQRRSRRWKHNIPAEKTMEFTECLTVGSLTPSELLTRDFHNCQ